MSKTLTCVYCGMAYPEGTPPHGAQILTDHIKVCKKHPMRKAEETILKLRLALLGLIGASDDKGDLERIEVILRTAQIPEADRAAAINVIHTLIETMEEE